MMDRNDLEFSENDMFELSPSTEFGDKDMDLVGDEVVSHQPFSPPARLTSEAAFAVHYKQQSVTNSSTWLENRLKPVRTPSRQAMADSDTADAVTHMGTSVPIEIPMWTRYGSNAATRNNQSRHVQMRFGTFAQEFVPPHHLSQRDAEVYFLDGQSPSASLKKEKIRLRNAVLRSTGFIEAPSMLHDLHDMGDEEPLQLGMHVSGSVSQLSQALGTIQEVA